MNYETRKKINQNETTPEINNEFPTPEDMKKEFIEAGYEELVAVYQKVVAICEAVKEAGGTALLVGGSVRDRFFGKIPKDFDLEVYGLEAEKIREIVSGFGNILEAGKAFGVLKVFVNENFDIDVSLPRKDSKTGEGHRGFDVETDPFMTVEEAAKRRDFTINSMAADPLTGKLHDPFSGLEDIRNRNLKITDPERFKDDPLRVMRGLQFIGRFGLKVDEKSLPIIKEMIPSLRELPKERIFEEWKKLLVKSDRPSLGLMAGMNWGVFDALHTEFPPLAKTKQEPDWHPEGDVWMHTLMSVDEAARFCRLDNIEEDPALVVMLSSLCHDLGKQFTTTEEEKGGTIRWISHGHEQAGKEPTKKFLASIGASNEMREKILKLVVNHMIPSMWFIDETVRGVKISKGAFNRLAKNIFPATIQELVLVAESDHAGRGPFVDPKEPWQYMLPDGFPAGPWFLKKARELGVEKSKPQDLIMGRELIGFGFKPGPSMGEIIRLANDLRDEKDFTKDKVFQLLDGLNNNEDAIKKMRQNLKS